MKRLSFALLLFIFAMNEVSAHTEEGIHPELHYDFSQSLETASGNQYLKVVQEDTSFPELPQKEKFLKALSIIEDVLNSEEFRGKVLSYVNRSGKRQYAQNFLWEDSKHPLTNEDIYAVIMKGDEKMRQNTQGEMNLNSIVKTCSLAQKASTWCRTVIGSTSPYTSKWIELNWKFYSTFKTHEMVTNLVHEWLHLIGFIHGKENLQEEVPYVVGAIAGEVAQKLLREKR